MLERIESLVGSCKLMFVPHVYRTYVYKAFGRVYPAFLSNLKINTNGALAAFEET